MSNPVLASTARLTRTTPGQSPSHHSRSTARPQVSTARQALPPVTRRTNQPARCQKARRRNEGRDGASPPCLSGVGPEWRGGGERGGRSAHPAVHRSTWHCPCGHPPVAQQVTSLLALIPASDRPVSWIPGNWEQPRLALNVRQRVAEAPAFRRRPSAPCHLREPHQASRRLPGTESRGSGCASRSRPCQELNGKGPEGPRHRHGSGLVQLQERRHGRGQAPAAKSPSHWQRCSKWPGGKPPPCWGFPQDRPASGLPALPSGMFQCTLESLPPRYPLPHRCPPPPPTPKHFF